MKRLIKVIVFIMLLVLLNSVFTSIAIKNVSVRANRTVNDFYSFDEDIDILFIGSSLVYHGVNTFYIDLLTGKKSFVLATPSQRIDLSYFLIKEAIRTKDIKKIVLDTYSLSRNGETSEEMLKTVFYNLKFSSNKMDMLNNFEYLDLKDLLFPLYDLHSYIYENATVVWNVVYRNGFAGRDGSIDSFEQRPNLFEVGSKEIEDDSLQILKDIIELCDAEGIELELITIPYLEYQTESRCVQDVTAYNNYITQKLDIKVHNYNLEFEKLGLNNQCFRDEMHLNKTGAAIFSKILAVDLGGDIEIINTIDDFDLDSVNKRGWYEELLLDPEYGKGYVVRKSPTNSAKSNKPMFYFDFVDDTFEASGDYLFSAIIGFDRDVLNGNIEKLFSTEDADSIEYINVTSIDEKYYRVEIKTYVDMAVMDINEYFYINQKLNNNVYMEVYDVKLVNMK